MSDGETCSRDQQADRPREGVVLDMFGSKFWIDEFVWSAHVLILSQI